MSRALMLVLVAGPVWAEELAEVNKQVPTFRLPVYNAKEFGESSVAIDSFVGPTRKRCRTSRSCTSSTGRTVCG